MDPDLISDFWRSRASSGRTRWSQEAFLVHEHALLGPLIGGATSILDLGSGFGELSRGICPLGGELTAVDQEPLFGTAFVGDERFTFIRSDVCTFRSDERFDLILLFGVVTYLAPAEEARVYQRIAALLNEGGRVVVKNQCADGDSFEVDTFSEELGARYVGRYPSITEQLATLANSFSEIETRPYPDSLKVRADSSHVAFICSRPKVTDSRADDRMAE